MKSIKKQVQDFMNLFFYGLSSDVNPLIQGSVGIYRLNNGQFLSIINNNLYSCKMNFECHVTRD